MKVLIEPRRGYGSACLAAVRFLEEIGPETVVFMDADYSSDPREIDALVRPLLKGDIDLVIGCRTPSKRERDSMSLHVKWGNKLALILLKLLYHHSFNDLGPFRAITWRSLQRLGMEDEAFGWPIEMMIKALKLNLRIVEVDVSCRKRIGKSKISGTLMGSVKAGYGILSTILRYAID